MPKFNGIPITDGNIKGGLEVLHIRIITWLPQTNPSWSGFVHSNQDNLNLKALVSFSRSNTLSPPMLLGQQTKSHLTMRLSLNNLSEAIQSKARSNLRMAFMMHFGGTTR
jgi:hypothetical protein